MLGSHPARLSHITYTCLEASAFGSGIHPGPILWLGNRTYISELEKNIFAHSFTHKTSYWAVTVYQTLCCPLRSSCGCDQSLENFRIFSEISSYRGSAFRQWDWLIDSSRKCSSRRGAKVLSWVLSSLFVEPLLWWLTAYSQGEAAKRLLLISEDTLPNPGDKSSCI